MSPKKPLTAAAAVLLSVAALSAQPSVWTPPASGHVYDSLTATIRPIVGYIGAAYAGQPLAIELEWASVAPNGRSALILSKGRLDFIPDLETPNRRSGVLESIEAPIDASWSANSGLATLLAGTRLIRLSGLGGIPAVEADLDLKAFEQAEWALIAADHEAGAVLLSARSSGGAETWLAGRSSPPVRVAGVTRPTAAAFSGSAVYIADSETRQILRFEPASSEDPVAVLDAADGIGNPTAVLPSADGRLLWIADSAARTVRGYDLASRTPISEFTAPAESLVFVPAAPARFLLNRRQRQDEPFLFLETAPAPRLAFVPAGGFPQ